MAAEDHELQRARHLLVVVRVHESDRHVVGHLLDHHEAIFPHRLKWRDGAGRRGAPRPPNSRSPRAGRNVAPWRADGIVKRRMPAARAPQVWRP